MHGGERTWRGACVAEKTVIVAHGTYPTGMHSCLYRNIE